MLKHLLDILYHGRGIVTVDEAMIKRGRQVYYKPDRNLSIEQ
jgi:hypothetical protein